MLAVWLFDLKSTPKNTPRLIALGVVSILFAVVQSG
jgi:hypothetical protein